MKIYVISGGPCSGKTTTINMLKEKGYYVIGEAARIVLKKKFGGKSAKEVDPAILQREIFELQKKQLSEIPKHEKIVFSDRGFVDVIGYLYYHGLKIPEEIIEEVKRTRYEKIFFMEKLNFYVKDKLRQEQEEEAEKISFFIEKAYKDYGYDLIRVPYMTPEKRVSFILENIDEY